MSHAEDLPEVRGYEAWQVYLSALVGVAVAALSIWWASGFGPFYETLFRVGPTATGPSRGVGADWVAGNTIPSLDFLVALVHAADVLMGLFILLMVFLHWAAFRRLANRMRQPDETGGEAVAADGGTTGGEGGGSE
ncbi:hypothetical protein [Halobellus rubicundus]|uniref:DUF4328 domain-containing protein n=1 Tax=Halobellus rubicundus TaxID=2996466 RepID=A0ABD5MDA1_9EURY